ncbi:MAG TPA: DcaP family trimeric outer membrane transporter [Arthrobacter sp.]
MAATAGAVVLALIAAASPAQAQLVPPISSLPLKNFAPVASPADTPPAAKATAQKQSTGTAQAPPAQRISDIDNEHQNVTGAELKAADFPGLSFAIPETNARIGFGGFVKLDAIADLSGVGDKYEFILGKIQIPGEGKPQRDGYFYMQARETRFYVDLRNITQTGRPLRLFTEMDFWMKESSDFRLPIRIRHFYAVYDHLTVGYTWGTATDPLSWPTSIDFGGEAMNGARRAVLRWEQAGLLPRAKWAVSVENDTFPNIYNPDGLDGEASPRLPVLAARINQQMGKHQHGHWMLGAQIRELRWDGPAENSTAIGWGVSFSGRAYLGKSDFFTWNASAGDAWAGNTSTLLSSDQSAVLTSEGRVDTVFTSQAMFGVSHYFSPTLALNANAGVINVDRHPGFPGDFFSKGVVSHFNLIWSPWEHVNTGLEYTFGGRTNVKGDAGYAHRLQYMLKFIM